MVPVGAASCFWERCGADFGRECCFGVVQGSVESKGDWVERPGPDVFRVVGCGGGREARALPDSFDGKDSEGLVIVVRGAAEDPLDVMFQDGSESVGG